MRKIRHRSWLLAVLLLTLPGIAAAAGLGRLTILSAIGQPLVAEIDLISVQRDELATLSARLAPPEAFNRANIQYSPALVGVRMSIERRPSGQHYVRITSTRPVSEPFIDLLVELSWAQGRLLREYTALVDPPGSTVAAAPTAPVAASPAPAPAAPIASSPMESAPAGKPATAAKRPVAEAKGEGKEFGPVKRGDTLSKIASSVKPEGVTLEQTLVSLFRNNPDAFAGNNMNRLRTGTILRVPDRDQIAATGQSEATKEVRVQTSDWNAYRQKLADAAGTMPARETKSTASGKITTTIDDQTAAKQASKEVLKLSKGEPTGAAGKQAASGKGVPQAERTRALEEEAIAREKALTEATSRIAQLEKTIKDMQRLMEMKGQVPAGGPAKGEQAKAEPTKASQAKAEPPKAAAEPGKSEPVKDAAKSPAEPPKQAPAVAEKPAVTEPPKAEVAKADAPKAEPPKEETKVAEQPKPKVVAPPPPPPTPDLMDQILGEPLYLGAAGGGLLALLGGGYWYARRRRASGGEVEAAVARSAPSIAKVAAPVAAAEVGTATAAATAEDVDPIQEADLYLSFGRDAQAESVLKEALEKNPKHEEAQLKLLQIYASRKDKGAFESIARGLHDQVGPTSATWLKAAGMGFGIDPANALYEAGKTAGGTVDAAASAAPGGTDLDFDLELAPEAKGTRTDFELEAGKTVILDAGAVNAMQHQDPTADTMSIDVTADIGAARLDGMPATVVPDFTIDKPADVTATAEVGTSTGAGPLAAPLDFNFESPADTKPADKGFTPDGTVILDPDKVAAVTMDFNPDATPGLETIQVNTAGPLDSGFKLDLGADAATPMVPDFKLDGLDLKLDETIQTDATKSNVNKDDHWYDVQTKFDLAKAYQEMGDKDGAREILNEVVKEGDAEQQAEAKKLLDTLA